MLLSHQVTLCQKGHGPYIHIGQTDYLGEYHEFDWFCGGYDLIDDYGNALYFDCDAQESLPSFYIVPTPYRQWWNPIPANEASWDEDHNPWLFDTLYWTDGTF